MKSFNQPIELIVDESLMAAKSATAKNLKKALQDAGVPIDSIQKKKTRLPPKRGVQSKSMPGAAPPSATYVRTKISDAQMNPWDVAHLSGKALGRFVEPDLLNEFVSDNNNIHTGYKRKKAKIVSKASTDDNGYDPDWQPHRNLVWHLGDEFSQLKSARDAVADSKYVVRIGHIDTGYSKTHPVIPDSIRKNPLQRSFVDGEEQLDAHDRMISGGLKQPNHGTGTLGLLAGTLTKLQTDDGVFNDYLGGAWFADIVCCRIAPSVILMKTSAFAEALNYLTSLNQLGHPVHVVSMSMGGAPSRAWAKAVNAAYAAGITLVTAAGNNFNGLPTQHVVYPARFKRVVAACGVTHDFKPYFTKKVGEMRGCYGPDRHMDKALGAFTPNTPWANSSGKISFSGAGTSSATPQIAAAAAIYYRKYHQELDALQPWQRVEAIRHALYKTALKKVNGAGSYFSYFGNGILQANAALTVPVNASLPQTPEDKVPWFPILNTLFKSIPGEGSARMQMFNTELGQLVFNYPQLAKLIDNDDKPYERVGKKKWKEFSDAVIEHPAASMTLKKFLMATH